MRILSQDGRIDIPYEKYAICMFFNEMFSRNYEINAILAGNKLYKMAGYSTAEKAQKAMEMLHETYMAHNQYNIMTAEQRAVVIMSTSEKEQENLYGLFRFPADDEIEV